MQHVVRRIKVSFGAGGVIINHPPPIRAFGVSDGRRVNCDWGLSPVAIVFRSADSEIVHLLILNLNGIRGIPGRIDRAGTILGS